MPAACSASVRTVAAACFLALALSIGACSPASHPVVVPPSVSEAGPSLSASDTAAVTIYSLVIRRLCGPDDTGGGRIPKPAIYLVRSPVVTDPELRKGVSVAATIPVSVQQAITQQLSDLKSRVVWVDRFESVPRGAKAGEVRGGGVIITLGDIHPVGSKSVHVIGNIYFASLGAGGRTYVLDNARGTWRITGTTGVEWIS
jgi:hypothetical protein